MYTSDLLISVYLLYYCKYLMGYIFLSVYFNHIYLSLYVPTVLIVSNSVCT